jgi:hypothetical protein
MKFVEALQRYSVEAVKPADALSCLNASTFQRFNAKQK